MAAAVGPINRLAALQLSGIGIRYPRPGGTHPLTGTRAPDLALAGPGLDEAGRLYEALRDGQFVLVAPPGTATFDGVRPAVAKEPGPTMLVRPDGYLAWVADQPDPAALRAAVTGCVPQPA